ncbi:hypothetical protein MUB23_00380 [Cuneatibacter sp. NSJ-177]|uniref:hypothetical protein n=1 Tax=Cuneatibacter sp. NSJ-177 TaxID=2931401 RepID=UPI001FD16A1A|nr:hypothetical protein [Cuneatibacter sp. NSJ-177]MCJ7833848.1 hypothetical protein [Cuneatibacter sp. NSJ-177]
MTVKAFSWILENQFADLEVIEIIADAVGCNVKELALCDYEGYVENVIEWIRDQTRATVSLSQKRTISRVRKLAKEHPEKCQIVAENKDGSICAHIPVSWVKIVPGRALTDEQRTQHAEQLKRNLLNADCNRGENR